MTHFTKTICAATAAILLLCTGASAAQASILCFSRVDGECASTTTTSTPRASTPSAVPTTKPNIASSLSGAPRPDIAFPDQPYPSADQPSGNHTATTPTSTLPRPAATTGKDMSGGAIPVPGAASATTSTNTTSSAPIMSMGKPTAPAATAPNTTNSSNTSSTKTACADAAFASKNPALCEGQTKSEPTAEAAQCPQDSRPIPGTNNCQCLSDNTVTQAGGVCRPGGMSSGGPVTGPATTPTAPAPTAPGPQVICVPGEILVGNACVCQSGDTRDAAGKCTSPTTNPSGTRPFYANLRLDCVPVNTKKIGCSGSSGNTQYTSQFVAGFQGVVIPLITIPETDAEAQGIGNNLISSYIEEAFKKARADADLYKARNPNSTEQYELTVSVDVKIAVVDASGNTSTYSKFPWLFTRPY